MVPLDMDLFYDNELLQKKAHEIYYSLSKKKKKINNNMVVNDRKISQKIKNKR